MEEWWIRRHPKRRIPAVDDTVFVAAEGLKSKSKTGFTSLDSPRVGPCVIKEAANPNFKVELTALYKGELVDLHLKYLKLAVDRDEDWEAAELGPSPDDNDE